MKICVSSYSFHKYTTEGKLDQLTLMDKAKELLRQTDEKIIDIAAKVGYASGNSFCRAFKRRTGSSATTYRNGMEG